MGVIAMMGVGAVWRGLCLVVGLGLLLYSLPLALELLVLSVAALFPVRKVAVPANPKPLALAVVIPAHNEEKLIAGCVRSVLDVAAPNVTVWVVAHNCSDATAQAAEAAGARALVLNDNVGGKGVALDYGFGQAVAAGAEALMVVDADSQVSPNLTAVATARFQAGAQALQCRYEVANPEATTRTQLLSLAFLGINVLRPRGRDRLGLSTGIFGNGFALKAETLARVPYTANSLVEDLEYHLHLIRAGIRVEFIDEAAVFGEMPANSAASATQRARWEGGRRLMRNTWVRPLALEVARGHLRMAEPLLDLLVVPLAAEALLFIGVAVAAPLARSWLLGMAALAGLLTMVLYVVAAASLSRTPAASLRAIAAAPSYIAWKIWLIPQTRLASRRDARWVRTGRNADRP